MRNTAVGALAALAAFCMAPQAGHAAFQNPSGGNLGSILQGSSKVGYGAVGSFLGAADLSDTFTFTTAAPNFTATIDAAQSDYDGPGAGLIQDAFNNINPLNLSSASLSGNGSSAQTITVGGSVLSFAAITGTNSVTFAVNVSEAVGGILYRLTVTAVPLPAALPLLATALAGLWYQRRRKSAGEIV